MATVLIIDSDAEVAETLSEALGGRGVQALVMADGAEGLKAARNEAPDAIVLIRWHTPGSDPGLLSNTALAALGPLADLDIPAITEGRVAMIDDPLALTPSLAMGDFARRLGEILDSFEN